MYLNEWDPRLNPGTGTGKLDKTNPGKCLECEAKGDATRIVQHHNATGHRVTYRGVTQECDEPTCPCKRRTG